MPPYLIIINFKNKLKLGPNTQTFSANKIAGKTLPPQSGQKYCHILDGFSLKKKKTKRSNYKSQTQFTSTF